MLKINLDACVQAIAWNDHGLVAAIAQDNLSKEILMMAWMNEASFRETVAIGQAVYWSRSRAKRWHKGEESGHFQNVKDIRIDCDGDVLVLLVEQVGGIACHTGAANCFFRAFENHDGVGQWVNHGQVLA
jgi:phosphoribosyl-AMP cyclohydrolase